MWYNLGRACRWDLENRPVFNNPDELRANIGWLKYLSAVYGLSGEPPSDGYPICTNSISLIYMNVVAQIPELREQLEQPSSLCPTAEGQLYSMMTPLQDDNWAWIWNSGQFEPLEPKHWVEVTHQKFDETGMWMYYAPGSGVWFWTGDYTLYYDDHANVVSDLLGQTCNDNQCTSFFPDLVQYCQANGISSVQFIKHADMQCGRDPEDDTIVGTGHNGAIEIWDPWNDGHYSCAPDAQGASGFWQGWQTMDGVCDCDEQKQFANCRHHGGDGVPPWA